MPSATITIQGEQDVTVSEENFTVRYEITAQMGYDPGRYSGPPENCYPEESECDITEATFHVFDEDGNEVDEPLASAAIARVNEDDIEQKLWDKFNEPNVGDY